MNTGLMEQVPPQFMGRVQNTFYFFGTFLQVALGLAVGWIASRISLAAGFGVIAAVYAGAFCSARLPGEAWRGVGGGRGLWNTGPARPNSERTDVRLGTR